MPFDNNKKDQGNVTAWFFGIKETKKNMHRICAFWGVKSGKKTFCIRSQKNKAPTLKNN